MQICLISGFYYMWSVLWRQWLFSEPTSEKRDLVSFFKSHTDLPRIIFNILPFISSCFCAFLSFIHFPRISLCPCDVPCEGPTLITPHTPHEALSGASLQLKRCSFIFSDSRTSLSVQAPTLPALLFDTKHSVFILMQHSVQ